MRSPRLTRRVTPPGIHIVHPPASHALSEGRRLTSRDHHVVELLAEHKALTADQVARVAFPNATRARHRLLILVQRGVLVRFRHGRRLPGPGRSPSQRT